MPSTVSTWRSVPARPLGLVGESGSGKSTLARLVAGLLVPTAGTVEIGGADLARLGRQQMRALRRDVQVVFQDPYGALNPRRRVGSIIADPLVIHGVPKATTRARVQELMELVGLNPEHHNRFPAAFSGGQRQRIGVARALALEPRLVICDEPVSALDVSIQAQIINLLQRLQRELDLTYLVVSHDLGVIEHIADRVAVMYLGRIVEMASTDVLFAAPRHPYTAGPARCRARGRPARSARVELVAGDVPSPIAPPRLSIPHRGAATPRTTAASRIRRWCAPATPTTIARRASTRSGCRWSCDGDPARSPARRRLDAGSRRPGGPSPGRRRSWRSNACVATVARSCRRSSSP